MTYRDALEVFNYNPQEVNAYDRAFAGYDGTEEYAAGYRIYALDERGDRYTINQGHRITDAVEHQVFYWHDKAIAQGYMLYLADAQPQRTFGLYPVVTKVGTNEWKHNYGQVAKELTLANEKPVFVLTPELFQWAKANPDKEIKQC